MSPDLDQTCPRTACGNLPPHRVGRHRDPRDELFDGPSGRIDALNYRPRQAAHRLVTEAPALMPEVVELVDEIHRLDRAVAASMVDKDRQVHAAMQHAESCEQHGKDLADLGSQLQRLGQAERRADEARTALLGMLHAIKESVRTYREGWAPETTVDTLMQRLDEMATRTAKAHDRAWKR